MIPFWQQEVSNHRIIPGETVDGVLNKIKQKISDCDVEVRAIGGMNPSAISITSGEAWERIVGAVSDTWRDAIVSPYLMLACSDSRHYGEISDKVYRFSALKLTKDERASIHGNNEKISVEQIGKSIEFYTRLMRVS